MGDRVTLDLLPPRVALLVHLSDLHIVRDAPRQALVFDKLVETIAREREASSAERIVRPV